jgi:hypothetical protein
VTLGSDVCPLSPPPHILPDPQKGAPLTELPLREMIPFRSPISIYKIPQLTESPGSPMGLYIDRETPISRVFFYTFPSKFPVNEPPHHVLQQGPHGERIPISKDNGLFIHLYLSESPIRSSPTKTGKIFGHRPRSPTWTEGLLTMRCGLVPQGDRLRHCNLYPSAMQPSA